MHAVIIRISLVVLVMIIVVGVFFEDSLNKSVNDILTYLEISLIALVILMLFLRKKK